MIIKSSMDYDMSLPAEIIKTAINRQQAELAKALANQLEPYTLFAVEFIEDTYEKPALDCYGSKLAYRFQKIVRCRECKWFEEYESTIGTEHYCKKTWCSPYDWKSEPCFYVNPDDFCSYGEET